MISEGEDEVEATNKKKMKTLLSDHDPARSFSSIPDEIVLNCFARVPKRDYASLSVVCKSFRSLLTSPELYVNRRESDEICFYVCLHLPNHPSPRWYSLWVKAKSLPPPQYYRAYGKSNPSEKTIGRNLLVPISASLPVSNSMVAVGSDIYAIGGSTSLSSSVRIFDCRRHTWRDAPNMAVARRNAMAFVIGRKIFVMGGCSVDDEWSEVFDTKTRTWEALKNPEEKNFAEQIKKKNPRIFDLCQWWWVTDKVMYCYTYTGSFMYYDSVREKWIFVRGLERLLKLWNTSRSCRMVGTVSYGGKVVLMYESPSLTGDTANKEFWCAVVSMERHFGDKIRGRIMWIDLMLTVPKSYDLLRCLAVSV